MSTSCSPSQRSPGPEEIVRAIYGAFARRDLSLFERVSPDVTLFLSDFLSWGAFYQGITEVYSVFARWAASLDLSFQLYQLTVSGEQVRVTGQARGRIPDTDIDFDIPAVQVWTIRGGAVTGVEVYLSSTAEREEPSLARQEG